MTDKYHCCAKFTFSDSSEQLINKHTQHTCPVVGPLMTLVNTAPREAGRMNGCRGGKTRSHLAHSRQSSATKKKKKMVSLGWKAVWDVVVDFWVRWCAVGQSSSNYSPKSSPPPPAMAERWAVMFSVTVTVTAIGTTFRSVSFRDSKNNAQFRTWAALMFTWCGRVLSLCGALTDCWAVPGWLLGSCKSDGWNKQKRNLNKEIQFWKLL